MGLTRIQNIVVSGTLKFFPGPSKEKHRCLVDARLKDDTPLILAITGKLALMALEYLNRECLISVMATQNDNGEWEVAQLAFENGPRRELEERLLENLAKNQPIEVLMGVICSPFNPFNI